MAKIIAFHKEEKLAILRIMLEINDHYSYRFSQPSKLIQDASNFLRLPNGASEAYSMSSYEAKTILVQNFKNGDSNNGAYDKKDFFENLLSQMIHSSKKGVFGKVTSYRDSTPSKFIEEWDFIFSLLKGYVKPCKDDKESFAIKLSGSYKPLESGYWGIGTAQQRAMRPIDYQPIPTVQNIQTLNEGKEKLELRKDLMDIVRKELKDELKDVVREELKKELFGEMKEFMNKEKLYKDL